ncbi:MAG: hypothetical protein ACKO4T_10300 [Planctomycetaceae bacterium]
MTRGPLFVPPRPSSITAAITALVLIAIAGCGPKRPATVPVRGTVTLDGKPVASATVLFQPPQGVPGRAITGGDGGFTLTTFIDGDGAIPGRHRVAVTKFTITGLTESEGGVSGAATPGAVRETWITPQKYASLTDSGLEVEVETGMSPVALELKSK